MRFIIPQHAKNAAKQALNYNRKNKSMAVGLSGAEANLMGINSGIERAFQIIKNKTIDLKDAKRIIAFYERFKNCKTVRCEQAIKLWGGRKWALELKREINSLDM